MKKIVLILLVILSVYIYATKSFENFEIPSSAIRFRILANSNSAYDQNVKENVRDVLQKRLFDLLKDTKDMQEAKQIIKSNMNDFKSVLNNKLKDEKYSYKIDYGMHYFPEKTYKGVIYKEGDYESLLVTLGDGKGDNWWCVLFPPLCVLEAEDDYKKSDVEYKFFIKDFFKKYFIN